MTAREVFGPTLRHERERRGLTLSAVAHATKINPHLLAALERGDVSRWPGGLYRRAFVRAYAEAVGLPPEPTVCDFVRLFPEPGQEPPPVLDDDDPRRLRLMLVTEPEWPAPVRRAIAALVDAAVVLGTAYVVATFGGVSVWVPAAIGTVIYHAVGTSLAGQSLGSWLLTSGRGRVHQPLAVHDELARLRLGITGLLDAREGRPEHHAAT